jgi:hypothetical protein
VIYIITGVILIFLAYFETLNMSRKYSIYSLFFVLLTLALIAGLRENVGPDWNSYLNIYHNPEDSERVEFGYRLINDYFRNMHIPYNLFLIFINIFSLSFMYFFIKNNTKLMALAVLLFFCDLYLYYNLSGIRQAVAISITCYSVKYVINNNFYKFILCVLIASSFHATALVFTMVYLFPRKPPTLNEFVVLILLFCAIFMSMDSLSDLITILNIKDANYYTKYQDNAKFTDGYFIGLLRRLILIILLFFYSKRFLIDKSNCLFVNIYIIGLIIYITTYNISPDIGVRLSSYFIIFEIIIIGRLIWVIKSHLTRSVILVIFIIISLYKIIGYMKDETYNYKFAFNTLF